MDPEVLHGRRVGEEGPGCCISWLLPLKLIPKVAQTQVANLGELVTI